MQLNEEISVIPFRPNEAAHLFRQLLCDGQAKTGISSLVSLQTG